MTAPTVSSRIFTHTVVIGLRGQVDAIGSGLLRHELVNAAELADHCLPPAPPG
jgi:hypothetical protein